MVRNQSLSSHTLPDHPEAAETIRRVLTIPPAKTTKPLISYLNPQETRRCSQHPMSRPGPADETR